MTTLVANFSITEPSLNENCNTTTGCYDNNTYCTNTACQCMHGYYDSHGLNVTGGQCLLS